MQIETKFSPGDHIWCTSGDGIPRLLTVGQVRVVVTDTPGLDTGDGIPWDNYKARYERVEEYMCVETGVGSGSVYTLNTHAFAMREECEAGIIAIQARIAAEDEERSKRRREYELAHTT